MGKRKATCPRCGSERGAEVLYGLPVPSPELEARLEAGEVVLGGCEIVLGEPMPEFRCLDCGAGFSRGDAHRRAPTTR